MSSLGDAYATRSDEEGFGKIYGGNQSFENEGPQENQNGISFSLSLVSPLSSCYYSVSFLIINHLIICVCTPRTQGSDVKEQEKARHEKEKGPDLSNAK